MKNCCGNCRFSEYDKEPQDYVCTNDESDNYWEFVGYSDCCEEFEEKD